MFLFFLVLLYFVNVNLVKKLIVCRQCRVASFFLFTVQRSGPWEINGKGARLCLSVSSCADRTRMARLLKWCQLLIPPSASPCFHVLFLTQEEFIQTSRLALTCPCYSTLSYRQIRTLFICSPYSLVSVVLFFFFLTPPFLSFSLTLSLPNLMSVSPFFAFHHLI